MKQDSPWIRGYDWMREPECNFPMMTVDEVTLQNCDFQSMRKEVKADIFKLAYVAQGHKDTNGKTFNEDLLERYQLSRYIIDPNLRRYTVVVRILALCQRFINNLKERVENKRKGKVPAVVSEISGASSVSTPDHTKTVISEEEVKASKLYFFKKATSEVKHFMKESQYGR